MAKKGLGRGFDSLIPTDVIKEEYDVTAKQDKDLTSHKHLLIQDIKPNPKQPRKKFSDQALSELAESIKQHGVLQPILVVAKGNDFHLVAGERRWRAAQLAGLEKIPALVRDLNAQAQLEISIIENLQREDLTPIELATAILKLREQFNMTPKQIGERMGKADSTVSNIMRLMQLPDEAKIALNEGKITEMHARAILALVKWPEKQKELLDLILKHNWTAKKAEQFVIAVKQGADSKEAVKRTMTETKETKALAKKIKAPVRVRHMANGGRIIIEFKDDKDFERITKML